MKYKQFYKTSDNFDNLVMYSDGMFLTRLTFIDESDNVPTKDLPIFDKTKKWLDIYFDGKKPDFNIEYKIDYKSSFQKEVLDILCDIEYGQTLTYGEIASIIASKRNIKKMSVQAVGGAVGSNPICIIIPCHRVVGKDGSIVGYHGGIKNKLELLSLEKSTCLSYRSFLVSYNKHQI